MARKFEVVVELNAIRLLLHWEGLEVLESARAKGAPRSASPSSFPTSPTLGNFTDDTSALGPTFCQGVYAEYNAVTLYELFSSQQAIFESARFALAVTAACQN